MKLGAKKKTTAASSTKPKKGAGFFQMNIDEFKKASQFGHEAAAAYIVLCGGVDTKKSDTARICTHGCQSVSKRGLMGETRAVLAIKELLKHNLITEHENRTTNKTPAPGLPTYYINDDQVSRNIIISQEFLTPSKKINSSNDYSFAKQSLAYLWEKTKARGTIIPRRNAFVDALALFFALHQNQDFDLFAGVDPKVARGTFRPVQDGEGWDDASYKMPMQENPSWTFFSMIQEGGIGFSKAFLEQTFDGLPTWDKCPSHEERCSHAFEQLKNAWLIYNTIVLWESNPLTGVTSPRPDPIYTLYVASKRNDKNEVMLQHAIHDAMLKSKTLAREVTFPVSGNLRSKPTWTESGVYTYVLDGCHQSGKEILLLQLRVARWAANGKMNELLNEDRIRTEKWKNELITAVNSTQAIYI